MFKNRKKPLPEILDNFANHVAWRVIVGFTARLKYTIKQSFPIMLKSMVLLKSMALQKCTKMLMFGKKPK